MALLILTVQCLFQHSPSLTQMMDFAYRGHGAVNTHCTMSLLAYFVTHMTVETYLHHEKRRPHLPVPSAYPTAMPPSNAPATTTGDNVDAGSGTWCMESWRCKPPNMDKHMKYLNGAFKTCILQLRHSKHTYYKLFLVSIISKTASKLNYTGIIQSNTKLQSFY